MSQSRKSLEMLLPVAVHKKGKQNLRTPPGSINLPNSCINPTQEPKQNHKTELKTRNKLSQSKSASKKLLQNLNQRDPATFCLQRKQKTVATSCIQGKQKPAAGNHNVPSI